MNKILVLALILSASINAQSQFFLGGGVAYKNYAQKYSNSTGFLPAITFGYNFNFLRLHLDIDLETSVRNNDKKEQKIKTVGETNMMLDYLAKNSENSKFYAGLGIGTVTFVETHYATEKDDDKNKDNNLNNPNFKVTKEKRNNKSGLLAELGYIHTFGKVDLGVGLKRYLTSMNTKEAISISSSGNSMATKGNSITGVTTAEIFAAYVF